MPFIEMGNTGGGMVGSKKNQDMLHAGCLLAMQVKISHGNYL